MTKAEVTATREEIRHLCRDLEMARDDLSADVASVGRHQADRAADAIERAVAFLRRLQLPEPR